MPILVNGVPLRDYISRGGHGKPRNKLPRDIYEEALQLKETYSLKEMARMWGLTKDGAASRVRRARQLLEG
ncbi:MAG: hypothetical protein JRE40_16250 [Deltaproteobacteria bacterium]|nr:hypothetical protein [Deltaproteobacteria bacterium]